MKKVLFWLFFVVAAVVLVYFSQPDAVGLLVLAPTAAGGSVRITPTPGAVYPFPALSTASFDGPEKSFLLNLDCGQGAIFTSYPAKCMTAQGLREVAPRAKLEFPIITPIPLP